ncbi:MAG: transcription antitermination factor NusB [Lachnospiraceae bacterium]|nr:transcription antitermination factor NusB [Lachnospiraceae bacterium]MDD3797214.1 transcription antitermination factor NusB [Lachnospiraceae bacterium]
MSRRETREHIFKILFGIEFNSPEELQEQMELYFQQGFDDDFETRPAAVSEEDKLYVMEKAARIEASVPKLDEEINKVAKGWKTARMAKADLTIIRLAVYEMKYDDEIPVNVAINEAVELAKKFGSEESSSFVNGILAKLV